MSLYSRSLNQTCLYWPTNGSDAYGQPVFGSAVELPCRWIDKVQEIIKADGTTLKSQTRVLLDEDVMVKGFLKLGELKDINPASTPLENSGTWEILKVDRVPDFKGETMVKTAYLGGSYLR